MKKIFTIRDTSMQQTFLWKDHIVEDEVAACDDRNIKFHMFKYLPKDEEVIEAGCGLGAWVVYLASRGYHIKGVDNNNAVIDQLKSWNPDLPVATGDICNLPHDDASLGGYISLGVVEHFEEGPDKALREAFRVLKRGGVMLLTVPFDNMFRRLVAHPLRKLFLLYHKMRGGALFFAEYRYSEPEVTHMVEKAGFEVLERDTDDFIEKTRSLTLWSELPFLQDQKKAYHLNVAGRLMAFLMNSISRKIAASGILVVARKPVS